MEVHMNSENTLIKLKQFCLANSGSEQFWTNKDTTYYWNRGKDTSTGLINGVVRKLAGIDSAGAKIWVVAGSFKINPNGTVARFTGIPSKVQKTFEPHSSNTSNPINFPALEVA
jgi:hypothetical protein